MQRVRSLLLVAITMGCVVVASSGASADSVAALDAKARNAFRQIVSIVNKAAAESRAFAAANKNMEARAQGRRAAEAERASATTALKVEHRAAKEQAEYKQSGGKNKQALKSALSSYDLAIAAAGRLARIEATIVATDKGMSRVLSEVESSAKKIRADINDLSKAVGSLDRTVRSMKAKKMDRNLVAQWERQLGKAKSDRDQIAALRPVIQKRVKEARKLAAIPSSPAAAQKKIAQGDARHQRAIDKLESLEAKRAVLAMEEEPEVAAIAKPGMTFDGCDVRKVDWKNFQYYDSRGGTLRDGQVHWETEDESHDVSLTDVLYADLDGDSEQEAYVWVTDWLDWANVGAMGSENLHIFTVDATCRLVRLGEGFYSQDVAPGKLVGKRYVVIDEIDSKRVEWSFKDGKLTSTESRLED